MFALLVIYMDGWMAGWVDGWLGGRAGGWMDGTLLITLMPTGRRLTSSSSSTSVLMLRPEPEYFQSQDFGGDGPMHHAFFC